MNETLVIPIPKLETVNPRVIFNNLSELSHVKNSDGSWTVTKDENHWFQYGSDWMESRSSGETLRLRHCSLFSSTNMAYTGFYRDKAWILIHGISGTITNVWIQWWGTLASYHADVGTKLLLTSRNNTATITHTGHSNISNGNGRTYCTYNMSNELEVDTELLMEVKEYSGASEGDLYTVVYNIVFEFKE